MLFVTESSITHLLIICSIQFKMLQKYFWPEIALTLSCMFCCNRVVKESGPVKFWLVIKVTKRNMEGQSVLGNWERYKNRK